MRYRASLPSTQTAARELAEAGAPEGTLVVADEQTRGLGRRGSSFHSPRGGLYCSLVLRPPLRPAQAPAIGLAAGLALAEAVHQVTGLRPLLKWPNDLLLRDRKLSGLLVDLATAGETIRYAVLGLGLNVNISSEAFPPALRTAATSLQIELGRTISRDDLLVALLAGFERCYDELLAAGSQPLLAAWRAWPNLLGRRLRLAGAGEVWQGVAADLDDDGALIVRRPDGSLRRAIAAEVHLLPATTQLA